MTLNLKYVNGDFDPIYYSDDTLHETGDDGEIITYTVRNKVFIDELHKRSIILAEHRYLDEDRLNDLCEMINYLQPKAYTYFSENFNLLEDITVYMSQVYGTSTDYIIILGKYIKSPEEALKYINQHQLKPMKYIIIDSYTSNITYL